MRKQINTLTLMLLLLCTAATTAGADVGDVIAQGTCGSGVDAVSWVLTENDDRWIFDPSSSLSSNSLTITISGTGAMPNYNNDMMRRPWHRYCSRITRVVIREGVNHIGGKAFKGCHYLTEVIFSASVTHIGEQAFYDCPELKTVIALFDEQPSIGGGYRAFEVVEGRTLYKPIYSEVDGGGFRAPNMVEFESWQSGGTTVLCFDSESDPEYYTGFPRNINTMWIVKSDDTGAMADYTSNPSSRGWNGYASDIEQIKIWPDVTKIGNYTFANFSKLTSITIPDGVTAIGAGAFSGCSLLTSVKIPNRVTSINNNTFENCTSLQTISIPNSVITIGNNAFRNTSLRTLSIPNSVTTIGYAAFSNTILRTITIPNSVQTIGSYAFMSCHTLSDVYFEGIGTQWNSVSKGQNWNAGVPSSYKEHWRCSVHFITERGTAPAAQTNLWSNEDRVTPVSDPVADGYEFTGWYKTPDYIKSNQWNFTNNVVTGDMTLYAGWVSLLLDIYDNVANNLSAFDGDRKTVTLTGRTLYCDGDWNTLCLPFSLNSLAGTPLEGLTVKELDLSTTYNGHVTGFDSGTLYLNFKDATGIEAGKPYIVRKDGADASTATYTATSGTAGYNTAEGYASLVDGNIQTKWCSNKNEHSGYDNGWICEFNASKPVNVTGYTLTTANDVESDYNYDRNPIVWSLQAKLNSGDEWTTIDSRNAPYPSDDALPRINFTSNTYTIAANSQGAYQYFRFVVSESMGNLMQLAELTLQTASVSSNISNPVFTDVTINTDEPTAVTSKDGKVSFVGSYSPVSLTAGDKTVLYLGSNNKLFYPSTNRTLNSCRALFQLNGIVAGDVAAPNSVSACVLNFGDSETTGILNVNVNENDNENDNYWYSLDGRKLSEKPTQKGVYIHNGKKMVIK